ncbi:MAG: hypothetical protein U0794_10680 [Isosphaeraceae bacterium]
MPGYAPDLNPVEMIWAYLKHGRLSNFVPGTSGTWTGWSWITWQSCGATPPDPVALGGLETAVPRQEPLLPEGQ